MKKCYIFAATGEIDKLNIILNNDDFVIAADAGYLNAKILNIKIDLVIGDFDSLKIEDISENYEKFPSIKNKTDTIIAIDKALSFGFKDIIIVGGTGGRIDHLYANIQTLKYIYNNNATGKIIDNKTEIYYIKNTQFIINKRDKNFISVISFSDTAVVTLEGLLYPLKNHLLDNSFPLGVSNAFKDSNEPAKITVKNGEVIIILSK